MFNIVILIGLLISCSKINDKEVNQDKIEVDLSACYNMFDILSNMKNEKSLKDVSLKLDSVLNTKAYKTMFRHYNRDWRPNHLPKDVFKRMILSLQFPDQYTSGEKQRADQMLPKWKDYYNNLDKFEKHLKEVENIDIRKLVNNSIEYATSWLPPEMTIDEFYLFIHPNGGSPGFAIDNAQGYDFFQLSRDSLGNLQLNVLGEIIAHECHHLGLETPDIPIEKSSDSLAFYFLQVFVGEGTANKFINNCTGGNVPRIDSNRKNTMMDPGINKMTRELWEEYTLHENEIFNRMVKTFENAFTGNLTREQLNKELGEYWITGMIAKNYFIGSELFGAIYFGFDKEGCFDVMRDPRKMFDYYNKAIEQRSDILSQCPRIPDSIVKMALSIGEN